MIALLACGAIATVPTPTIRTIPGARMIRALPDGTAYILSAPGFYSPTPGAWMQECSRPAEAVPSLSRVDLKSGEVLWTTCLPFLENAKLDADARTGAATVAGSPGTRFRAFGAGIDQPRLPGNPARQGIGIIRLRPDGTAPEYAVVLASGRIRSVRLLADGTAFLTAHANAPDLPVTEDAIDRTPSPSGCGYMLRLSADGSQVLFGSYYRRAVDFFELEASSDRSVTMSGVTVEPATLSLLGDADKDAARFFLARFDVSRSRLQFFSATDLRSGYASLGFALFPDGKVAIAFTRSSTTSALFLATLHPEGDKIEKLHPIPITAARHSIRLDASGNAIVSLSGAGTPPPVTANSLRRPVEFWQTAVLGIDPGTGHLLFSHVLPPEERTISALASTPEGIIAGTVGTHTGRGMSLVLPPAEPVAVASSATMLFAAQPKVFERCGEYIVGDGALFWDVRQENAGGTIQVREGSPEGKIMATGATGVMALPSAAATYYLVLDPHAGPFARPRVLATENTLVRVPLRCSASERGTLYLSPNPILSCGAAPWTGTQVRVGAHSRTSGNLEVHIGHPDGPVLVFASTRSRSGLRPIDTQTGDWVRTGMEFYLTNAAVPRTVLASQRAYLLPVRDCAKPSSVPPPAMRAVRDCAQPDTFTLAFHPAGEWPLEIRSDSPDGETIARLVHPPGLVDVTTQRRTTYHLMSFQKGSWISIASTIADPRQACEQGRVR